MKRNAAGPMLDVRRVPDKIVEENHPTCQDEKGFFFKFGLSYCQWRSWGMLDSPLAHARGVAGDMTTVKRPIEKIRVLAVAIVMASLAFAETAIADVYKYVDKAGNIYFSDEALPGAHLSLEWKRTSKRLVTENKAKSDKLRQEQDEIQARIDARLEARLKARTDPYALRPADPVSGSMSVRRARYRHLIEDAARRHGPRRQWLCVHG